jgi:hydroxymethylbilane synthase
MDTSGDRFLSKNLYEIGGKGLFTQEIEQALIDKHIDIAIHSLKDLPAELPEGLHIGAFYQRYAPEDLFLSCEFSNLNALPKGATVGTSSPRRAAQTLQLRPDLKIVPFRGNVQTRLEKLRNNVADATFLAQAGIDKLDIDLSDLHLQVMDTQQMLPAVGQGTLAIQTRIEDERLSAVLNALNDTDTTLCTQVERAFLREFEGSCRTPIAGLAKKDKDTLNFYGQILSFDGSRTIECNHSDTLENATQLGKRAACELLEKAGDNFFGSELANG